MKEKEGEKKKNKEILINWLIQHVISTGAGCQVPPEFTLVDRRTLGGPAGINIKTALTGGEGKDTNRRQESEEPVCFSFFFFKSNACRGFLARRTRQPVCVKSQTETWSDEQCHRVRLCVNDRRKREGHRGTRGHSAARRGGGVEGIRRKLHVSRTVMAVERRHARLSVKLETTGAQLTTKSLIVRTSVHSHSRGITGDGWRVKWRLRPTPLSDGAAFLINNNILLDQTAVALRGLYFDCCSPLFWHEYSEKPPWVLQIFVIFFLTKLSVFRSPQHPTDSWFVAEHKKKKKPSQSEVIEMHFDLLHLNGTPHIHCYHSLPGGSRPPLRAKKKPLPSLMQRLFLTQVSAWMDLKGAGCSACSPSPQCKNSESCIIWQVIIIKAIKGRAQPKSKTLYFLSYL